MGAAAEARQVSKGWHQAVLKARVPIGTINPGDTVWWHPDIIHAAEETVQPPYDRLRSLVPLIWALSTPFDCWYPLLQPRRILSLR